MIGDRVLSDFTQANSGRPASPKGLLPVCTVPLNK